MNDIVPACDLIEGLLADKLLADRAYDANKLLALAERQNHEVVIPPVPVSYTHLDVYKRQTGDCAPRQCRHKILHHRAMQRTWTAARKEELLLA